MKKNVIYGLVILAIVLAGIFTLWPESSRKSEINTDIAQKVVLGETGLKYQDVVVEAGKPIILSADSSVTGCARSVVFNLEGKTYSKYLQTPSDAITLPPLEKGTYNFACSMGMVSGKLIVK